MDKIWVKILYQNSKYQDSGIRGVARCHCSAQTRTSPQATAIGAKSGSIESRNLPREWYTSAGIKCIGSCHIQPSSCLLPCPISNWFQGWLRGATFVTSNMSTNGLKFFFFGEQRSRWRMVQRVGFLPENENKSVWAKARLGHWTPRCRNNANWQRQVNASASYSNLATDSRVSFILPPRSAKEWLPGCVISNPTNRGNQEARFTQPRIHFLAERSGTYSAARAQYRSSRLQWHPLAMGKVSL